MYSHSCTLPCHCSRPPHIPPPLTPRLSPPLTPRLPSLFFLILLPPSSSPSFSLTPHPPSYTAPCSSIHIRPSTRPLKHLLTHTFFSTSPSSNPHPLTPSHPFFPLILPSYISLFPSVLPLRQGQCSRRIRAPPHNQMRLKERRDPRRHRQAHEW